MADLVDRLVARVKAGDPAELDALLGAYPEHADELRRLLPAVRLMADLSRSGAADGAVPDGAPLGEDLGDYRLIRDVGRGGMGVVYEAEQRSLRRRVALKVLPWAAAMDPRQLQRFKNEALAAASLKHDHIVSIYAVGCERGVHYYAMEFIDGPTLAQLIHRQRPAGGPPATGGATPDGPPGDAAPTQPVAAVPTERTGPRGRAFYRHAAELIAQAADALEHAHQLGIVHRDVKPANLLLDAAGKLYVSDFGLARLGADAGLTLTGDLLGTLRYMSPEQALAKHGLVDHRTDVYALGATLYELLTLRPAVGGEDKQEVLRRIAFEEPTPPRKVHKAIPVEVETVALKCLAKNPVERYATAGELAEDLRRWLGDQTIKAKPPGWRQRAAKWARRHKYLVRSVAGVFVLAVAGLVAATVLILREKSRATVALREANDNFQEARDAVDQMLTRLASERLAGIPQMVPIRRELLEDALHFYQRFLAKKSDDPAVRQEAARAYWRVGVILDALEDYDQAIDAYTQGIALYEQLATGSPGVAAYRRGLADCFGDLGRALYRAGNLPKAAAAFGRAHDLFEKLAAEFESEPDYLNGLAGKLQNLAVFHNETGNLREARRLLGKAIEHEQAALKMKPRTARYQDNLVGCLQNLTNTLLSLGERVEAEKASRRAVDEARVLKAAFPKNTESDLTLANALNSLGHLLRTTGRAAEAEQVHREALTLLEPLAATYLYLPHYDRAVANIQNNLGIDLQNLGRLEDADLYFQKANALYEKLIRQSPEAPDLQYELACALHNVAAVVRDQGQPGKAREMFERAIRHEQKALETNPRNSAYREFLRNHYYMLGQTSVDLKDYRGAENAYRRALELAKPLADEFSSIPDHRRQLGSCLHQLGGILDKQRRAADAKDVYRQALAIREKVLVESGNTTDDHSSLGATLNDLARMLLKLDEFDEARACAERAVVHQKAALKADPRNRTYLEFLRNHYRVQAILGTKMKNRGEAAAAFQRSVEVTEELASDFPEMRLYREQVVSGSLRLAELCKDARQILAQEKAYLVARAYLEKLAAAFPEQPQYKESLARVLISLSELAAPDGRAKVTTGLDDQERARLRDQALAWLRAELGDLRHQLNKEPAKAAPAILQQLQHWLQDTDFAGVRGDEALARLPEAERADWQKLWADVETLRRRAGESK
jgi:serine/threonine protein kinase/tetratricopeptide (TPR) repeat protein